eukprot:4265230-Amphidinium_carterae.1
MHVSRLAPRKFAYRVAHTSPLFAAALQGAQQQVDNGCSVSLRAALGLPPPCMISTEVLSKPSCAQQCGKVTALEKYRLLEVVHNVTRAQEGLRFHVRHPAKEVRAMSSNFKQSD